MLSVLLLCGKTDQKSGERIIELVSKRYDAVYLSKNGVRINKNEGAQPLFAIVRRLLDEDDGMSPDLVVLLPGAGESEGERVRKITARAAVVSGETPVIPLEVIDAGVIVTCGMSPRDTVTCSSIGDQKLALALQREITTLADERVEEQEILISIDEGTKPEEAMTAAVCLLLLGVPPACLYNAAE